MSDVKPGPSPVKVAQEYVRASLCDIRDAYKEGHYGTAIGMTLLGLMLGAAPIIALVSGVTGLLQKPDPGSESTADTHQSQTQSHQETKLTEEKPTAPSASPPPDLGKADDPPAPIVAKPQPRFDPYAYIDKYIDRTAGGRPGKANVALHIFDNDRRDVVPIEGVVQNGLRDRGWHVVPLFRQRFAQDGLDKELFRGSAALAGKLQLENHCDNVFLGVVRIDGSPRTMQGLIFTDVTFNLRKISVTDGSVGGEWTTSAKGGGLDAQSSVENALRELEGEIKLKLAEWTLS